MTQMNIGEITKKYSCKLDILDIQLLISHTLGKTREFLLANSEHEMTRSELSRLEKYLTRRISREPIAYIVGHKEFYGLEFSVDKHTLVPRPETELLVEYVLDEQRAADARPAATCIVDIGTGSGNIIISVANELRVNKEITFLASDISGEALRIAKKNAAIHGVGRDIAFFEGDLLLSISDCNLDDFHSLIIVANLPYLSDDIYGSASEDVKDHEPKSALLSPEQGLSHYRELLVQLRDLPAVKHIPYVSCLFEISPEQKRLLPELIKEIHPGAHISFLKDLAGKWRVCRIRLQQSTDR